MGFKRKPPTSLLNLIEGQPGKDASGKFQSKLPPPPPKPQSTQTRSSFTQSQPSSPQSRLPPLPQPADRKRKRASKGREPMDGGRSRSSQEEDEARRASKQLKIGHQGQEKEVTTQSEPQAWLPAPMLHREPLMDNASLRDFRGGEGAFVADALEMSLLIPADMAELGGLRRQEVFLSIKRYLGMVRLLTLVASLIFVLWLPTHRVLVPIGRLFRYRLEEETNDQGRALELECDKRLDATLTLKNFEADPLKARENLKEMTRARDSAELGLVSA